MSNFKALAILLLLFIYTTKSLSNPPAFYLTDKYIQTRSHKILSSAYFDNTSWNNVQNQTYDILFNRTYSSYQAQVSIQSINYQINSQLINITIQKGISFTTQQRVRLFTTTLSRLKSLTTRLLVLDGSFIKFSLYTIQFTSTGGTTSLSTASPINMNLNIPTQNLTGNHIRIGFFTGINATAASSSNHFDFHLNFTMLSPTVLQVKVTTQAPGNTQVGGFKLGFFSFNQAQMASYPFPAARANIQLFEKSSISIQTISLSSTLLNNKALSYNTFWGLYRLNIDSQSFCQFDTDFTPLSSFTISSSYTINNIYFVALAFQFKQCLLPTPYYLIAQDLCYDICPARYYQNINLCQRCAKYDCYKCHSNGTCSSCSQTIDFRTLQGGNCVPLAGYYDDGMNNSLAQACTNPCRTCQNSASFCTGCFNGYGLTTNNSCSACIQNCEICQMNHTGCTQCSSSYRLQNNTCKLQCPPKYYLNASNTSCILNCSDISFCLECRQVLNLTICDRCQVGYQPQNNTCRAVCGDSIVINGSQQCDDGNLANGDGCSNACVIESNAICSIVANRSTCSICPLQKYPDSTHSNCLNCLYECQTCNSSTACLSCSSASQRIMNIYTPRCIPKDGFFDDGSNLLAQPCHLDCQTCNGASNISCLSCNSNKILLNNSCFSCQLKAGQDCKQCSQSNFTIVCLSCFSGQLTQGRCRIGISLPSQSDITKLLLMILLPILAVLICACVICLIIWRRRKNQQNQVENQAQVNQKVEESIDNINQTIVMQTRPQGRKDKRQKKKRRAKKSQLQDIGNIHNESNQISKRQLTDENFISIRAEPNKFEEDVSILMPYDFDGPQDKSVAIQSVSSDFYSEISR